MKRFNSLSSILILLTVLFLTVGASCNDGPAVPPPIPAETELKIYQAFYQIESKYNASYDLVVEFTKLAGQTTTLACSAGPDSALKPICDGGKKYQTFYDTKLRPASEKATEAYLGKLQPDGTYIGGALNVFQDYRKGTATEATLQERIDALRKLVDDVSLLFGEGKSMVVNNG